MAALVNGRVRLGHVLLQLVAKLLNSGQTCVAPDYVMVDRRIREPFVAELTKAIDGAKGRQAPPEAA